MTPFLRPENEVKVESVDSSDSDDDEEKKAEPNQINFVDRKITRELSMADAKPGQVQEKRKHLDDLLPDEQTQIWHRKHATRKSLHKEPP